MIKLDFVDVMLGILFAVSLVVLFWALYKEVSSDALGYFRLASVAAALAIASTFIAAMRH